MLFPIQVFLGFDITPQIPSERRRRRKVRPQRISGFCHHDFDLRKLLTFFSRSCLPRVIQPEEDKCLAKILMW